MICDLFLGIEWESLEAMNKFFQDCNKNISNHYPCLLDGDNKGQE